MIRDKYHARELQELADSLGGFGYNLFYDLLMYEKVYLSHLLSDPYDTLRSKLNILISFKILVVASMEIPFESIPLFIGHSSGTVQKVLGFRLRYGR